MLKRIISVFLSTVMCTSLINTNVAMKSGVAENSNVSKPEIESDIEITGTNSLARYISNLANNQNKHTSSKATPDSERFEISNLEFDDTTGAFIVTSSQSLDCRIKIDIINEDTNKLIITQNLPIKSGIYSQTEGRIAVSELPQYYIIKTYIIGTIGNIISNEFVDKSHTKVRQKIATTDIYDFQPENIINLDECDETNFMVLTDDTVKAEVSNEHNLFISADYDNNVFKLQNADDTVKNIKKGQFFYYQPNNEDIIAISVDEVSTEDDITTIKGNSDIEDMFEFIKIESTVSTEDSTCDNSKTGIGYEYQNNTETGECEIVFDPDDVSYKISQEMLQYKEGVNENTTYNASLDLGGKGIKVGNDTDNNNPVTVNIVPIIKASFTVTINHYFTFDYCELELKKTMSCTFGVTLQKKLDLVKALELELGSIMIPTPIAGVSICLTPKLVGELSAAVELTLTISDISGFVYEKDGDESSYNRIYKVEPAKLSVKVKGTIYIGFKVELAVAFANPKAVSVALTGEIGLKLKGELADTLSVDGNGVSGTTNIICCHNSSADSVHVCTTCLAGDASLVYKVGAKITIFTYEVGITIAEITNKLTDWYLSLGKLNPSSITSQAFVNEDDLFSDNISQFAEFGLGKCPNKAYKVTLTYDINDPSNKEKDSEISENDKISLTIDGFKIPETSAANTYTFYCRDGSYTATLTVGSNNYTKKFTVHGKKKVVSISDKGSSDSDSDVAEETTTDVSQSNEIKFPEMPSETAPKKPTPIPNTVEMIQLGEQIVGFVYDNGVMNVYGCGDMYDFSSSPISKRTLVKKVFIRNVDDDNNEVITSIGDHVFDGCSEMTEIEMPNTIKRIGNYSFSNCSSLDKIIYNHNNPETECKLILPKNTTSVGDYAFYNCTSFNELVITDSVTEIGSYSFANCSNLINITFPKSLANIGSYAFANCINLTEITIPETVKNIGDCVFYNCFAIETAEIYGGADGIGLHVFNRCKALKELTLPFAGFSKESVDNPEVVSEISAYFDNCENGDSDNYLNIGNAHGGAVLVPKSLKKITILGGNRIPDCAFFNLKGVEIIEIPETITEIGNHAFENCTSLKINYITKDANGIEKKEFRIPKSIKSIGENAFINCSSAEFGDIEFPNTLTSIGKNAFCGCKGITSVKIPKSVKTIGESAFNNCSAIETAEIYGGADGIGLHIFNRCKALKELTLPFAGFSKVSADNPEVVSEISAYFDNYENGDSDNYLNIGNSHGGAVLVPKSLKKITILDGSRISDYAFFNLKDVEIIEIPETIIEIGKHAFEGCTSMKNGYIPEGIKSIGENAFINCSSAEFGDIEFPNTLTSIGKNAFSGCKGITSVKIPETVTTIGESAFNNCSAIETAEIYGGADGIGLYLFNGCKSLKELTLPFWEFSKEIVDTNVVTNEVSSYFHTNGDSAPDEFLNIGNSHGGAVLVPKSLKKLTILEGDRIPTNALLRMVGIEEIHLPQNITEISDNAFKGCSGIENVYYPDTREKWEKNVIIGTNNEAIDGKVRFTNDNGSNVTTAVTTVSNKNTTTTSTVATTSANKTTATTTSSTATTSTSKAASTNTSTTVTASASKATSTTTSTTATTSTSKATSTTTSTTATTSTSKVTSTTTSTTATTSTSKAASTITSTTATTSTSKDTSTTLSTSTSTPITTSKLTKILIGNTEISGDKNSQGATLELNGKNSKGEPVSFTDGQLNVGKDGTAINSTGTSLVWMPGSDKIEVNLEDGTYTLKELVASDESIVAEPVTFTVKNGKIETENTNAYSITIVNETDNITTTSTSKVSPSTTPTTSKTTITTVIAPVSSTSTSNVVIGITTSSNNSKPISTTSASIITSTTTSTVVSLATTTIPAANSTSEPVSAATTTTKIITSTTTNNSSASGSSTTTTGNVTTQVTTTTTSTGTTTTNGYPLGDVNNDGLINAVDASTVLTYYAMISTNKDGGFDDNQKAAADVNHDGLINAVDASCILAYYAYTSTTKEDILSLIEFININ